MANEGLNKVILIGNLGQDPELKYTQNNQAVLKMRLATTENYVDRQGQRQERTEWHTITLWGKRAEALSKFLTKGHKLCVEGRIQYQQWEDQNGQKRTTTEINATNVVLLGGGNRGGQQGGGGGYGGSQGGGYGGGQGGGRQGGGGYGNNNGGSQGGGYSDDGGGDEIPF